MGSRAFRERSTRRSTFYPRLLGSRGAVATMHYLSAGAAREVLDAGGNAIDAAVAAVLVEGQVNPHMNTIGGECPIILKMADSPRVHVINGNTAAPGRANPDAYLRRGFSDVPEEGILAAGVPATPGSLLLALERFGSMSFNEVAAPAIAFARDGFPIHRGLLSQERFGIRDLAEKFRNFWPASAALYLSNGEVPEEGMVLKNPALASMLDYLANAERMAHGSRSSKIAAVRDAFYRGDVAREIAAFSQDRDGLLDRNDLSIYQTFMEQPTSMKFGEAELFKCGFWTQGPTVLQCLGILGNFDLKSMGHNSTDYLHTLIETIKLVFADREQYYGDGFSVQVPEQELLSGEYAALRSALIDTDGVLGALLPGDPRAMLAEMPLEDTFGGREWGHGTVHVNVIDRKGNMVAATPSGAWIKSSEVVANLGFPLGTRLMTFYLGPEHHPNAIAPHKRPRTTISPSLATFKEQPWMVFGSMGGDQQDQWQLQFFLNCAMFKMTVQEAIEAPKLSSDHFPGFFAPHDRFPNKVRIEPRVSRRIVDILRRRGHAVEIAADWSEGYLLAAAIDPKCNVLEAGCDPRGWKGEIFPATAMCW
jgi:gamma-glutamyltranspeptidase / glutathione hydrolase